MKFAISSNRLKSALVKVGMVIPSRTTLPILGDILFELKGNVLYLTATDLEISVKVVLDPVEGMEDGAVAIPEDKITDIVKALPEGVLLNFETYDSNRVLITTDKGGEYSLPAEPSDSFPAIPETIEEGEGIGFKISGGVLKEIIENTIFATSKEEFRPATTGVFFQFKENEFIAVATDGYRLVKISRKGVVDLDGLQNFQGVIVPAKTLGIVSKSIEEEDVCQVMINEKQKNIQFSTEEITIISRLIDEKYPNYESVIPYENNKELVVERQSFLSAVKRVSIFANSTTNQIKFKLSPGETLEIRAEDIDFSSWAKEVLHDCTYNGDSMEIAFNAKYIVDVVGHLDSEKILFKFSGPTRPVIIQPMESPEDREILMIVMPMRLNT